MARKRRSPETDTELLEYVAPGDGAPVAAEPVGRKARRAAKKTAKAEQKAAKAELPKRQGRFGVRSMGIAYEAVQSIRGRSGISHRPPR